MAFELITSTERYLCLSTDAKPTSGIKKSALAKETDTGLEFMFNGTTWDPYRQPTKTDIQVAGADVSDANPLPMKLTGSLANNQTNKVTLANADILAENYTSTKYSKSVLQVMTNTAGVLSLVIDGVSGALNSGSALTANAWYEFDISLLSGSTYNLKLSVNATVQVKWQVV